MPFDTVSSMIEAIASTKGTKAKKEILEECCRNKYFRKVLQMALDADKAYFVDTLPEPTDWDVVEFNEVMEFLDGLSVKRSANNADKQWLANAGASDPSAAHVISVITRKDLKCGVKEKSVCDIAPDLLFVVPYQRCSKEDQLKKIKWPAVIQLKGDGQFSYGFHQPHQRTGKHFLSRNGSGYDLFGTVEREVKQLNEMATDHFHHRKFVTIGEMLVKDENGVWYDRQTSNGLIDKMIDGTGTADIAERIDYLLWNIIPYDHYEGWSSDIKYRDTFGFLMENEDEINAMNHLNVIDYEIVHNMEQAKAFYLKCRRLGLEGGILSNLDGTWGWNTAMDKIKLKNRVEAEFRIVDAYYGDPGGKYEHMLGGITVRSECNGILTNVGSGFSDKQRALGVKWWQDHAGGVVTCKFTAVIDDKTTRETKCLDNPSFSETRFNEKTVADTLEYCIELCKPPEERPMLEVV